MGSLPPVLFIYCKGYYIQGTCFLKSPVILSSCFALKMNVQTIFRFLLLPLAKLAQAACVRCPLLMAFFSFALSFSLLNLLFSQKEVIIGFRNFVWRSKSQKNYIWGIFGAPHGVDFLGFLSDTCAEKFPLVSMEAGACADLGARAPMGSSGNDNKIQICSQQRNSIISSQLVQKSLVKGSQIVLEN
jgi:hypothetical protein